MIQGKCDSTVNIERKLKNTNAFDTIHFANGRYGIICNNRSGSLSLCVMIWRIVNDLIVITAYKDGIINILL